MNNHPGDELFDGLSAAEETGDDESRRRRQRLLNLLRGRWKWVALLAAILCPTLAVAGFFAKRAEYTSMGQIRLNQYLPQAAPDATPGGHTSDEFLRVEVVLMTSPRILEAISQDEGWRAAAGDEADDLGVIMKGILVENVAWTNLLNMGFVHRDPAVAEAGARALMSAHKKAFADKYEKFDAKAQRVLRDRQTQKVQELNNLRQQRDNMTRNVGAENLDAPYQDQYKKVAEMENMLQAVKMALLAYGGGQTESPLTSMTDEQLGDVDAEMAGLLAMRSNNLFQQQTLRNQNIGENHREMRGLQAQLRTIEQNIATHGGALREGRVAPKSRTVNPTLTENATAEELKKREAAIAMDLESARAKLIDIGKTNMALKSLNTSINLLDQEVRNLNAQIDSMSSDGIGEHIEVISGAMPAIPYNIMKRVRLAAMGAFFGLFCAVGGVMLWGMADRRFRHIDDAELDLPRVLGSLPTLPESFGTHEEGVLVAHAVHHIRTLLQIGREDRANVFSVTSPTAGSGKTSLTMALGMSFAAAGCRTLLIDCDVVGGGLTRRMNASAHTRLGQLLLRTGKIDQHAIDEALKAQQVSGKRIGEALVGLGYITHADLDEALREQKRTSVGLLEACNGEEFGACIYHTGVEGLDVLPLGNALPQQAGVLSPNSIRRVLASARAAYDTVLVDTGPILGSIEASMAAAEADGSMLIISRGDKKALVDKCVDHLRRVRGNLVGVVFNHALPDDIARSSYGSITASQSRHPNHQSLIESLDADTSARYGPLATAVASYGGRTGSRPNGNGNGKTH